MQDDTSFRSLQEGQKLMVDFTEYPSVLVRMLNHCIKEPHSHLAVFVMNRDGSARLDFIQASAIPPLPTRIPPLKCPSRPPLSARGQSPPRGLSMREASILPIALSGKKEQNCARPTADTPVPHPFSRLQNMEYKFVELLSCHFLASGEDIVRQQITFRYNSVKV